MPSNAVELIKKGDKYSVPIYLFFLHYLLANNLRDHS